MANQSPKAHSRNLAAAGGGPAWCGKLRTRAEDRPARLSWQTGFQPVEVALGARDARLPMTGRLPVFLPPSRQRGTHFGFDLGDIHRFDHAIRIRVFAEIRATDRYAHLRLGQT